MEKQIKMKPFSKQVRRSGRLSDGNEKARAPQDVTAPKNRRLSAPSMSMPKMPDLLLSASQCSDEEGMEDKKDEEKMAEIIVKLQIAKQRASAEKKRKLEKEQRVELFHQFVQENSIAIAASKKRKLIGLQKLSDKKHEIAQKIESNFRDIQEANAKYEESHASFVEDMGNIVLRLEKTTELLERCHGDSKRVLHDDYLAAKDEIGHKTEQLDQAIKSILSTKANDKFSSLLSAVIKTFEVS